MKITLMVLLLFVLNPAAFADSDAAPEKAGETPEAQTWTARQPGR
jgi:hypothetical protein